MAEIDLSKYVTPPPPFMAGIDRLSQAISDIWNKRKADEELRIAAAEQEARQRNWEASAASGLRTDLETARHNMAQEAYDRGKLRRDLINDQIAYINDVAKAYNEGQPGLGGALAANSGLFGIAPRAMAAPTFDGSSPEPGVNLPPTPAASTEGVAPGVPRMVPAFPQQAADAVAAERGLAPPPAVTGQAPPQAELNTPQPPAPAQAPPEGPPAPEEPEVVNPYGSPAVPTAQPPGAPVQAAPPTSAGRREDIHIQPQPKTMLGQYNPVPTGPAELPPTPWQGDLSKHPTVLEANPYWEGSRPSTAPGAPSVQYPTVPGPALPSGQPGVVAGAAPGAVDPATGRQWLARGFAGPVMPNAQAIVGGNADRVRQATTTWSGYARDEYELSLARSAAASAEAAAQVMPADKAYAAAERQYFKALEMRRRGERATTMAEAQAGRFQRTEDREKANRYVDRQIGALDSRGLDNDVATQQAIGTMQQVLQSPNPTEYAWTVREALTVMKNKGVSTDRDAVEAEGKSKLSFLDNIEATVQEFLHGPSPLLIQNMRDAIERLDGVLTDRTRRDYETHRSLINESAPNDYAREQSHAMLHERYQPFTWSRALFDEERTGKSPARSGPAPQKREIPDTSDLGDEVR